MTGVVAAGNQTYLGSGTVSIVFAPPVFEMMISTSFMVDLNAEGGGKLEVATQMVPPILFGFLRRDGKTVFISAQVQWPWHIGPKLQMGEREDPGIAGHRH
jgi:hypothetical protein